MFHLVSIRSTRDQLASAAFPIATACKSVVHRPWFHQRQVTPPVRPKSTPTANPFRTMKSVLLHALVPGIFGTFLLASAALAQAPPPPPPAPAPTSGPVEVNAIVAKVNGAAITKNEVGFLLAPAYSRLVAQFPRRGSEFEKQLSEAYDDVIQDLVDREIILDEFKQLGAEIPGHVVDAEVDKQIRELYNGDRTRFNEELKRNRLTMPAFREMTREKMIVSAMRLKQFSEAPPPLPEEIRQEYNEVKLELRDTSKDQISFKKIYLPKTDPRNPAATPEEQLALAETIVSDLKTGADFAELAKKFSRDAFADEGGVQVDVPGTDLSPEFAHIIFNAKDGQLIGPLDDPTGYTIVIPTSRKLGPSPPFEGEIREQMEARVRSKKNSAQYERWIEARRKSAMIEIKK